MEAVVLRGVLVWTWRALHLLGILARYRLNYPCPMKNWVRLPEPLSQFSFHNVVDKSSLSPLPSLTFPTLLPSAYSECSSFFLFYFHFLLRFFFRRLLSCLAFPHRMVRACSTIYFTPMNCSHLFRYFSWVKASAPNPYVYSTMGWVTNINRWRLLAHGHPTFAFGLLHTTYLRSLAACYPNLFSEGPFVLEEQS